MRRSADCDAITMLQRPIRAIKRDKNQWQTKHMSPTLAHEMLVNQLSTRHNGCRRMFLRVPASCIAIDILILMESYCSRGEQRTNDI